MSRHDIFESQNYKEFIKALDIGNGKYKKKNVFFDLITILALTISNEVKFNERNNKLVLNIVEKYEEKERVELITLSIKLNRLYKQTDGPMDILGKVYSDLEVNKNHKDIGQVFSSLSISKLMCEMDGIDNEKIRKNGFVHFLEPACGAGILVLSYANKMMREGYDYTKQLFSEASDIDPICAYMTYFQFYMYGIPGIVRIEDSITREIRNVLYTPTIVNIDITKIIEEKSETNNKENILENDEEENCQ